jgi:hypothetical protein
MPKGCSDKTGAKTAAKSKPKTKCSKTEESCPLKQKKKIKLVELVEVVQRGGKEGTVVGAAKASTEIQKLAERTQKSGPAYKQFINLGKDIEGADKRHPEFDRYIELKARVEWQDGKKPGLKGKKIHFSYDLTKGDKRDSQLATGKTDLDSSENAYFEGGSGPNKDKLVKAVNDDGWTDTIKFYLSQYGGDKYIVKAQADEEDKGSPSGKELKTSRYEVWRRFWYQLTHEAKFNVPKPNSSVAAYKKVCAEMVEATTKKFKKEDLSKDLQERTFYSEYMVKQGGKADKVAVIGEHNKDHFYDMLKKPYPEKEKPVKVHLIVCQYQCDPKGEAEAAKIQIKSNPADVAVTVNDGEFVCKPALEDTLVVENKGEWSVEWPPKTFSYKMIKVMSHLKKPKKLKGELDDSHIDISEKRKGTNIVQVKLPADAPDPKSYEVYVKLILRVGKGYAGESAGHQILTVYDSSDEPDYNDTITHEIGHTFNQTPDASAHKQPKSLKDHPKWHNDAYGGSGDHCSTGATLINDIDTTSGKSWDEGTCVMYLGTSSVCKHEFCDVCVPYVRLQDMSSI